MSIAASISRSSRSGPGRRPLFAIVGLVVLLGIFISWKESLPRTSLAAGSFVRYDDFAFSVLDAKRLSPESVALTVGCRNDALRVPFPFKPRMIQVGSVADPKVRYSVDATSWVGDSALQHGESVHRTVTVRTPPGVTDLRVWFQISGDSGDFMEALVGRNSEFRVPVK